MTKLDALKDVNRMQRMLIDMTMQVVTVSNDWDDMETISIEVCRLADTLHKRVKEYAKINAKEEWDD